MNWCRAAALAAAWRSAAALPRRRLALGAVRNVQRLALSASGRWRGRFLSGGGRRRAALTVPLPAARDVPAALAAASGGGSGAGDGM